MTRRFLVEFAAIVRKGLHKRKTKIVGKRGRFPKRQLFLALNDSMGIFRSHFRCRVTSRWSVGKRKQPRDTLVLEYLVDYGICRFSIPQAIRQEKPGRATLKPNEKYEILLAVESELGNDAEVARDLLKLLDVKARLRCLVFRKRFRYGKRLDDRILWTCAHHARCDRADPLLLVGLPIAEDDDFADQIDFRLLRNGKISSLPL
jgi:hypothetical protein